MSRYDDAPHSPQTCRVLMVEDDPGGREPLAMFLRRRGYHVVCASTVAAGRAELDRGDATHLILDLRLPDGSGVPLLAEARKSWPDLRVAVVTGSDRNTLLAEAVVLRPDAFLRKPVDFRELLAWVEGGPGAPSGDLVPPAHHHHHGGRSASRHRGR